MEHDPLVSIITPCIGSSTFLDQAIRSVLAQDYRPIEYIVMDGGSTGCSSDILEPYKDRLRYISAPDLGAADAINNGFGMAKGAVLAWLSSDDTYLPGAVRSAVTALAAAPDAGAVYGEACWTDEQGCILDRYPTVRPFDPAALARECCICQPACFFRRSALESVGMLNAALHSAFDYDLWIRLSRRYRFVSVDACLATSRMHRANKSLAQRRLMFEESMFVLKQHYDYVPPAWIYGSLQYARDRRDQFYEPLRLSALTYLATFFVGSCRSYRHLLRYWKDWISPLSFANLRRLLRKRPRRGFVRPGKWT